MCFSSHECVLTCTMNYKDTVQDDDVNNDYGDHYKIQMGILTCYCSWTNPKKLFLEAKPL